MLAWSFVRTVALGVAGAALAVASVTACVVQSEPGSGYSGSGSAGGSGSSSGGSGGSGASAQPMLVDLDPDQSMNASPGEGVGVFIQYKTGGHWNIWWTCDTNKTGLGCSFDNTVTVSTGSITNLAGQVLEGSDAVTQPSAQKIEAVTATSTGVDGITFDTPFSSGQTPVITLDAKLNGSENSQYLFFVQDGKINGNYQGMLTDPLMLEPKTP
jgi:hypothetical protein